MPKFNLKGEAHEWVAWSGQNCRRLRAAVLEWVLMSPAKGEEFLRRVVNDPKYRKVFLGYYTTVAAVLSRHSVETQPPMLFLEQIQKVREELEAEERLLESARR